MWGFSLENCAEKRGAARVRGNNDSVGEELRVGKVQRLATNARLMVQRGAPAGLCCGSDDYGACELFEAAAAPPSDPAPGATGEIRGEGNKSRGRLSPGYRLRARLMTCVAVSCRLVVRTGKVASESEGLFHVHSRRVGDDGLGLFDDDPAVQGALQLLVDHTTTSRAGILPLAVGQPAPDDTQ